MANLDRLSSERAQVVRRALTNVLSTEVAELTYAQILDGLPTEKSLFESCDTIYDHPVCHMKHINICEGYIDKAREFRSHLDTLALPFSENLLAAFQNSDPNSKEFFLRLVELVVVACHQIGAYLFELDSGVHKHEIHNTWLAQVHEEERAGRSRRLYRPPPSVFYHRSYRNYEQYPRGIADVAGYWAEGRIFGGVVVFDRGESNRECKDMWIHGILAKGPQTLYPPTTEQFEALRAFLLADSSPTHNVVCPLPIHGSRLNRPRWDPMDSMQFHIFRDWYERKIPSRRPPQRLTHTFANWPELEDSWVTLELTKRKQLGEPIDEELLKRASEGLRLMTPSSPLWHLRKRG